MRDRTTCTDDSKEATFHFYGELNDFLARHRKNTTFAHAFRHRAAIKDMIESLGVPHTEVELILVDGSPRGWDYVVQDGDSVDVYPSSLARDPAIQGRLGPPPLTEARFVLDMHLGKLAAYLRLLGFDTLYRNEFHDEELAIISSEEQRILLTRDINLLKRRIVSYGYFVRETAPRRQVIEILRRFDLFGAMVPYTRCLRCNGLLRSVPKELIAERLAPKTRQFYHEFKLCGTCGQIYWKGAHFEPLQQFLDQLSHENIG